MIAHVVMYMAVDMERAAKEAAEAAKRAAEAARLESPKRSLPRATARHSS